MFLVDITKLRDVNDTLGQEAGDELIEEVARRIGDIIDVEDTVARVSGGEFMVLSEESSTAERARNLGSCILERIGCDLELSGTQVYLGIHSGAGANRDDRICGRMGHSQSVQTDKILAGGRHFCENLCKPVSSGAKRLRHH